jgi:hypothetical protein
VLDSAAEGVAVLLADMMRIARRTGSQAGGMKSRLDDEDELKQRCGMRQTGGRADAWSGREVWAGSGDDVWPKAAGSGELGGEWRRKEVVQDGWRRAVKAIVVVVGVCESETLERMCCSVWVQKARSCCVKLIWFCVWYEYEREERIGREEEEGKGLQIYSTYDERKEVN